MRRYGPILASVAALTVAAGCAARAPVLNVPPRYPEFTFPAPPPELARSGQATEHQRAWQYLQAGDLRTAQQGFVEVLRRDPGFFPAEAGLGYVHLAGQEYEAATYRFDAALENAPRYVPALLGRGEAYLAANRVDLALASFEAALAVQPALTAVQSRVEELRFSRVMAQVADARRASEAGRYAQARAAYERVLAASPESAFLYLELARVEQRDGNRARAVELARQAAARDPGDPAPLVLEGELQEALGAYDAAEVAYTRALALEASDDVRERLRRLRERARLAALPAEYRQIPGSRQITRGDLAALLGVRFESLLARDAPHPVIITDTRSHWADRWIHAVAGAGVMDATVNHQFQPDRIVTRSELAQAVSQVLSLIAPRSPGRAIQWQTARPTFSDMGPTHLSYPWAAQAVSADVMTALDGNAFQPTRAVSGGDAVETIDRLDQLVRDIG